MKHASLIWLIRWWWTGLFWISLLAPVYAYIDITPAQIRLVIARHGQNLTRRDFDFLFNAQYQHPENKVRAAQFFDAARQTKDDRVMVYAYTYLMNAWVDADFMRSEQIREELTDWAADKSPAIQALAKTAHAEIAMLRSYKRGVHLFDEVILYCQQHGLVQEEIQALLAASLDLKDYSIANDYKRSFAYAFRAAELAERHGKSSEELVGALRLIAENHLQEKNYAQAASYAHKALNMQTRLGQHNRTTINLHTDIGLIHRAHERYDLAVKSFNDALWIADQLQDSAWIGISLGNIGSVYLMQGNDTAAIRYYEQNIRISSQTGELEDYALGLLRLVTAYTRQKQFVKARHYCQRALMVIASRPGRGMLHLRKHYEEQMMLLAEAQGNIAAAYAHHKRLYQLHDSINQLEKEKQIARMQAQYDNEQREHEMEDLRNRQLLQAEQIRRQQWVNLLIGGLLLMAMGTVLVVYRAYDQKKKINTDLDQQRVRLNAANDWNRKLLSILAHDLRSPFNSAKGMLLLLQDGIADPHESQQIFSRLSAHIGYLIQSLDTLLIWASNQMDETQTGRKAVCFSLKEHFEQDFQTLLLTAGQKDILLQNHLGDHVLYADPDQIRTVLRNLISNAIKFTPAGGEVSLRSSSSPSAGMVRICVQDTGVGISTEEIHLLLAQKENIAVKRGTAGEKGIGLGLRVSFEFVRTNGGLIHIQSTPGQGSLFCIELPSGPSDQPTHQTDQAMYSQAE